MKILFLGDIVGKSGCEAVKKNLPKIIIEKKIDFYMLSFCHFPKIIFILKKHSWFYFVSRYFHFNFLIASIGLSFLFFQM